jgi:hypothetical protein
MEKDYEDERDAGDGFEYDRDKLLDDDDQDACGSYDPSDKHMNMDASTDSGYYIEGTDDSMSKDNCPAADIDNSRQPVEQNGEATELDEFGEPRRKYI